MKVLVCGYGSIGCKHALHLRSLQADVKVLSGRTQDDFPAAQTLEDGLAWCEAAVIANATDCHLGAALKVARAGKPFYLEKPVSHNAEGLDDLRAAAKGLVVEVGCQMRQHPNLKVLKERLSSGIDGRVLAFLAFVGQRLDQWRPGTDYRESYSADPAKGGGALFDLVHEIDLMTWFAGPMRSVSADLRQISDLEMKAEDLANLVLVAENGAAGTVQLDMVTPGYRRGLQVICEKAAYSWDMKEGVLVRDDGQSREVVDRVPDGYVPTRMLYDAMAHFLRRVADPSLQASCTMEEGLHDLAILLAARRSDAAGKKEDIV